MRRGAMEGWRVRFDEWIRCEKYGVEHMMAHALFMSRCDATAQAGEVLGIPSTMLPCVVSFVS